MDIVVLTAESRLAAIAGDGTLLGVGTDVLPAPSVRGLGWGGDAAGAMGDPTASGIRVSEIPAGVGLALPTLKPPDSAEGLQAVIATIAADAQSEAAVAEKAATDDGTKQDQLQGVVARDSDGDGAVDQFAVSFNKAQAQTDAPGEGAQSDKPPADSTPGAQKLPPTSWGVLGAAAVAAQQALNAAEGGPPAGSDAPAGADGGPPPGAQGVPSASQLLEQVKLANMVRLVITDEGARKELVASGDMANSLQTALVNISENDKSRSALGLMARAGGFQVEAPRATNPDGQPAPDGQPPRPGNEVAFAVPKLNIGAPPPPADSDAPGTPARGAPRGGTNRVRRRRRKLHWSY